MENFPFTCSYIPTAHAYGVYISQLIQHSRAYDSYQFLDKGMLLTRKLLNQEFSVVKLKSLLRMFYATMTWLAVIEYMCHKMTKDMFRLS